MTFAGRGRSVSSGLLSESALFVLVLALLLLCAHPWGACTSGTYNINTGYTNRSCYAGTTCANYGYYECTNICGSRCSSTYHSGNTYYVGLTGSSIWNDSYAINMCTSKPQGCVSVGSYTNVYCTYTQRCDTQAEADSAYCALNPTAEGCVEEAVPASCQNDYQQCTSLGGVWKKVASTGSECASECNLCNSAAQTRVMNSVNKVCCQQGKAPPDSVTRCIPPEGGSQWGMQSSQFINNDGNISCGALSTSDGEIIQENASLYKRFCIDRDEYEEQVDTNDVGGGSSSSGGEGGSSSEDIGHSFGTELEALGGLYGVLDTIRDTLTKRLTPATEEIRDCLYNFKLCTSMEPLQIDWTGMPQDTNMLQLDTAILKHVKPMLDSSVRIDSAQLKTLRQLDSLYKRGLVNDTDIVQAVNAIKGDINDVESAVKGVRHGIDSLIDSMTTYMDKVGQGLSAVGDSVGALRGVVEGIFDTSGVGAAMSAAAGSADTSGWGAYSDTMSSRYGKFITKVSGGAWGDSASLETAFGPTSADSLCNNDSCLDSEADSALGYQLDSATTVLQRAKDSLVRDTSKLAAYYDTLSREMQIFNFDSVLLAPLHDAIPTQNSCPEDCFKGSFRLELIGNAMIPYDYKLCERWSFLGGVDIFVIIRVLLRLITALSCVFIGIWYISGRNI